MVLPLFLNERAALLLAGADGRDWICVTGESAQLLPVAAALSDSSCPSLDRSNTHTHTQTSQSRIQSHSFRNINAYTPTQPFTPNNQLCLDALLKEQHALTHGLKATVSTETDATVCIYILCFFKLGFIRNESVYQYDFAVLVDE